MTIQEIQKLIKQIKMLLPTIQIQKLDDKSEEEIKDILAIYIMQFGNLNYQITLRALHNITQDDSKMKEFTKSPIPTLARESTKLTQFTEEEKRKHKESQEIIWAYFPAHNIMFAYNKATGAYMPEKNRPFTPLEEDFYIHSMMSLEEYRYWSAIEMGKEVKRPEIMRYDPNTRTVKKWEHEELISEVKR